MYKDLIEGIGEWSNTIFWELDSKGNKLFYGIRVVFYGGYYRIDSNGKSIRQRADAFVKQKRSNIFMPEFFENVDEVWEAMKEFAKCEKLIAYHEKRH